MTTRFSDGLFSEHPVMVCGLELNNPVRQQIGRDQMRPSVAALTVSTDKNAACYNAVYALSSDTTYAT